MMNLLFFGIYCFEEYYNFRFIPAGNEPSAVLARAFDECREGQIPRCSAALQAWYPVACSGVFDLKNGFVIGGLDTHVYVGTSQEGKSDILFYLDADKWVSSQQMPACLTGIKLFNMKMESGESWTWIS